MSGHGPSVRNVVDSEFDVNRKFRKLTGTLAWKNSAAAKHGPNGVISPEPNRTS